MNGWRTARLEEVAEVCGGGTPSRQEASYFGGEHAWATPTDVTALDGLYISRTKETVTDAGLNNSSTKLLPVGAVLLTSRATIGYTAVARVPICTNQGFVNFVCGRDLLPEYLAYWLRTQRDKMIQHAGGTTFKEIARGTLRKFCIPFPGLDEQRRIVDLLSRAEGIVRLRREAQAKAAEIIPALFLDMFGDPATNPNGWEVAPLGDYIELLTGYAFKSDEFVAGGDATKLCRGANVLPQRIDWSDVRYWPNDRASEVERYLLVEGDIVLAMDRPWISTGLKVARLAKIDTPALLVQRVARIRPKKQLVPEYVYASLCHPRFASHCNAVKTETLVPHISPHDIRSYPITLAPLVQQRRFASFVEQVESVLEQEGHGLAKGEATFQALLSRVFSNDLETVPLAAEEAAVA